MKRMIFLFAVGILFCTQITSCTKLFEHDEDDPLAHLPNVEAEAFPMSEMYNLCHCTQWAQVGAFLEHEGYTTDGGGGSMRRWDKAVDYQCLDYYNLDSLKVVYSVYSNPWGYFGVDGGHAYMNICKINNQIADKVINEKMKEIKVAVEGEGISKITVTIGTSTNTYYSWDVASNAFLSSWDPGNNYSGFLCELEVVGSTHIYYLETKCLGDFSLGRGFNILYGLCNVNRGIFY